MTKKNKGKMIKWALIALGVIFYLILYAYQYHKAIKPDIRYYEAGTKMDNFGLSYTVSGKMYDKEELLEEFGLEEYMLDLSGDMEKKFIVVEKNITKTAEEIEEEPNSIFKMMVYSKFWQVGIEPDLEFELQKNIEKSREDLKVGESTIEYSVFSIVDANHCKRLWESAEETTAWFEFMDTKSCPYVRRVRILN